MFTHNTEGIDRKRVTGQGKTGTAVIRHLRNGHMLRMAQRKWDQKGKTDQDRDIFLDISKMYGGKRKVREKYWKEFAQNIEECKSFKKIEYHKNKMRGKT